MSASPDLGAFRNKILCEDVREEVSNKKSLIGVYTGDIVVAEFPAGLRLAFYLEYVPTVGAGPHNINLQITIGEDEVGEADVQIKNENPSSIILQQSIVVITDPGDIVVYLREGESRSEILRKTVMLGELSRRS